jgi:CheY-like chemotaxis protein
VRFEVEDSGDGIEPAVLPRIYEPFFTTKPVGRGTGLGLAIVFGTVTSHGGGIDVRSTPGQGTRFTVWLNASKQPPAQQPAPSPTASLRDGGDHTVLVVDDDPEVRSIFREILEMGGYRVISADGAAAAISSLERCVRDGEPVDLALVDLVMPGMDGVACIEHLHALAPELPVLLCTGLDRDGRLGALPATPLIRVMRKPLSVDRLLDEVSARLQRE